LYIVWSTVGTRIQHVSETGFVKGDKGAYSQLGCLDFNIGTELVTLWTCVPEVLGLNLGRGTYYLEFFICDFPQANAGIVQGGLISLWIYKENNTLRD
jgi:hypothetical protein